MEIGSERRNASALDRQIRTLVHSTGSVSSYICICGFSDSEVQATGHLDEEKQQTVKPSQSAGRAPVNRREEQKKSQKR